jgi:hypothetical protein
VSTVDDSLTAQIEIATCFQTGNPAPVFSKNGPSMLALEYEALEVTQGTVATVRIQTAPHT